MNKKQKGWIWAFALIMLLAAGLACGSSGDGSFDEFMDESEEVDPTKVPDIKIELEVINNMEDTYLCYLFIAPQDAEEFGIERLGEDVIIEPGESHIIPGITPGEYKVKIHDCDGNFVNALYGVTMDQELMTWTIENANLIVANESSYDICEVYISPNSAPESAWGPNQMGDDILTPGETVTFFLAKGSWDIRSVPCDESIDPVTELGIDIEGETTWTLSDTTE